MTDNFYRAFEEKYRGSRELIKSRQAVYLPFVDPVLSAYPEAGALDIGCGRGEWLELLREKGHRARGMDLDHGMLDVCLELGLTVEATDAVAGLKVVPDTSLAVISAFHVVEHIPFNQLRILVEEAHRVLLPGGLLILETPNPENIVVGTASFYLDPTHQTPIPHQLLSFVSEYYGFQTVKVLRLNEKKILSDEPHLNLFSVLVGVSPDYSVVAQKGGSKKLQTKLTPFFEQEFGLSLWKMAETYRQQTEAKVKELEVNTTEACERADKAFAFAEQAEKHVAQTEAKTKKIEAKATQAVQHAYQAQTLAAQANELAEQAEAKATQTKMSVALSLHRADQELKAKQDELEHLQAHSQWLQNEWDVARAKIDELNLSSHHWWTVADGFNNELQSVYRSKFWRLTWPLRKLMQGTKAFVLFWRALFVGLIRLPRRVLRWVLTRAMRFVLRREGLKNRARRWLHRYPKLEAHLQAFARQRGLLSSYPDSAKQQYQALSAETVSDMVYHGEMDLTATLPPRARKIFAELKEAVEQKQKENG